MATPIRDVKHLEDENKSNDCLDNNNIKLKDARPATVRLYGNILVLRFKM